MRMFVRVYVYVCVCVFVCVCALLTTSVGSSNLLCPRSHPGPYSSVPVVSQWSPSGVTVVSQWCHSGVTVVLKSNGRGVTVVLPSHRTLLGSRGRLHCACAGCGNWA
jgi:hypothetical protein